MITPIISFQICIYTLEKDVNKIMHAIKDFRNGDLFDNELLEFFHAIDPDDAKLIVKNDMIDIYFIQKAYSL